jgi:ABC-type Fe2+-enterobactin transport system substrate-binding protein
MTLSTPVLIQPEVTFVACVGGTASMNSIDGQNISNNLMGMNVSNFRYRIKAILLSSEGWSITQIAQALRKHDSTISRHLMDFKNKQKLAPENGGSLFLFGGECDFHILYSLT